MKRFVKSLISLSIVVLLGLISLTLAQVISSRNSTNNKVPDYYYANYKFNDDWIAILDRFSEVNAMYSVNQEIPSSKFAELSRYFNNVFPHLTKDYSSIYQKCSILADNLSRNYSYSNMEALMGNSCYKSLTQAINKINSSYTVNPSVTYNPNGGMAPLTVTFDARNSSDPSMETIPENNFYRYYRDEKGVDRPIGQKQVLSYTFEEAGKFIVHLVVRSSNVDSGILDGERDITVNVTPKAADIVVYANTRRMISTTPLKIGIAEGEKGIVFDGSLTKPRGGRKILSHRWTITNSSAGFLYDSKDIDGEPSYINVPLKGNGTFKVTLSTKDNENNIVSEDYYIYLSDPVTIIRQTPENGTTSTTFNFDGSASYSITNRLSSYVWEVFNGNGDEDNGNKITMVQGKSMSINGNQKYSPGNYLVRLTVTDMAGNQNVETKDLYIESTTPDPQFTVTPTSKREYPSEFTLDASNTMDIDVDNGVDSLEYQWKFSTDNVKILSTKNNNERIVVQFNEKGRHQVELIATDQYGKSASVSKYIDVESTLRPEIEIRPGPISRDKTLELKSTVNREVWDYSRDFGDGTDYVNSESATSVTHVYGRRGVYTVKLTVTDEENEESNTVSEKAFIGEIDYPIATYNITDNQGFFVQTTDTCPEEDGAKTTQRDAYSVERYAKITIDPGGSVNTKGTTNGLQYVFEKQSISGPNQVTNSNTLTTSFSELGCHYVDLTVKDSNVGKQDSRRIRFNVKNAQPTIQNVSLSYPQAEDNVYTIGFATETDSNKSMFDCSGSENLTIKVTAVNPSDPDGNISRLRFYYYNVDDPNRILEYKESRITSPYVYFSIPRVYGEYKFGVLVYDNDGGMVDSEDYIASNPSVYFPAKCGEEDIPSVTLKLSSTNIQVGDEVTYTIVSKTSSDNADFKTDRTFYYDYDGDGTRDLVTKKDTSTYVFKEPNEDGIIPKAAVEYRGRLGQGEGAKIIIKNGVKPRLLYNSYGNTVIFRDISVGVMQQRQICFEVDECDIGNTKFRRTHIVTGVSNELTGGTETSITQNDAFEWKYDDYGTHKVSLYLKNKYGNEVKNTYDVKTSENTNNGKIAPGINMITIPETTFTNKNPEIFLSKDMNNTLVMYIHNENGDTCYVDVDTETDSDGDSKTDNDKDVLCNKMVKIKYEPDYEHAVGAIYFMNDGKLTFRYFYVTFEGIILELDEEKKEIYNDISILINGIEDELSKGNTDLKRSLDRLRKNLNNKSEVTTLVLTIKEQINEGGIQISQNQKENLDSILGRLSNKDTIVSVGLNKYEKSKREIIALLPKQGSLKSTIEKKFEEFDEKLDYGLEEKADMVKGIRDIIIKESKKNEIDEEYFTSHFCDIYDYFNMSSYTDRCSLSSETISENYNKAIDNTSQKSEKSGFPLRLKIILIVLVGGLLAMGGIILFFSIKAKMNSSSEDEDEG